MLSSQDSPASHSNELDSLSYSVQSVSLNATPSSTPTSLRKEFLLAQQSYYKLEQDARSTSDASYQSDVVACCTRFSHCSQWIRQLSLFSSNETLQDVSSGDIKYMLTDAYMALVYLKRLDKDRLRLLSFAEDSINVFLSLCQDYEVLSPHDVAAMEAIQHTIKHSAAKQREEKIANYKREKALKEMIQTLNDTLDSQSQEQDSDDIERDVALKTVQWMIIKTLDELRNIKDEKTLLQDMRKQTPDQAASSAPSSTSSLGRLDILDGPILNKQGKPMKPFIITNKRKEFAAQVFRPGWNLPTMTIDEYLDSQMAQGNILSGGGKMPAKPLVDDEDEEEIDKQTYKTRAFDDFKDDNPRGWGNKMNRG